MTGAGSRGSDAPAGAPPREDETLVALRALVTEIDRCTDELRLTRERAVLLLAERGGGRAWLDIVSAESRPLVVERISTVLSLLAGAGSAWRRAEARALQAEHVSTVRIAELFGVTRQRISALLRE